MAKIPAGKKKKIRSIHFQALAVLLFFVLMIATSSVYVNRMMRDNLSRESAELLAQTRFRIEAALTSSESALRSAAQIISQAISLGADRDEVLLQMANISRILRHDAFGVGRGLHGFFEAFDGVLLDGANMEAHEGFDPRGTPWFETHALDRGEIAFTRGVIARTQIYACPVTGEHIITLSQRIIDDDGQALGVLCIDVPFQRIVGYVAAMSLTPGSYGVLFDEDLYVRWHPTEEVIGENAHRMGAGVAEFAAVLAAGYDLAGHNTVNYRGAQVIVYTMRLDNGWVLHLSTPRFEYFRSHQQMTLWLVGLGMVLATLLVIVLTRIDKARMKSAEENHYKDLLLAAMERDREMDKRTQLMLDAMPLCCILWDKDFSVVSCNEETARLFRLSSKREFPGRFFDFSPEMQPCGRSSEEMAREKFGMGFENGYCRFDWQHKTNDGETFPAEVTLVRIKHQNEFILVAYTRNMRELKATLDEMQRVEQDLRLARDAAESSNRAKSAFLANMSHEIRTPMNSIVGFSELALSDNIPVNTRNYISHIQESAQDLLQIINDILDISKIESGKMEIEYIPFNLNEVLTRCRTTIMPKAIEKGITLSFYAEPSLGKLLVGDPTRLRQILINFLSNAVKFTNHGMVKLAATVTRVFDDKVEMRFEIKDTGIGMSQEQINQIYEPFVQADSSTTRKFGGTGLGLAIARSMIMIMGGEMQVESKAMTGSKFSFALTLGTQEMPNSGANVIKTVTVELEKPVFDGEVLVCEDNIMNQQVIHEHLSRVGLRTVMASNGQEAIDIILARLEKNNKPSDLIYEKGGKPFDLIFMDIHMPVMDGLEAASKIAVLGLETPIVAMTANIMISDREQYRTIGMHDCVGKPFTSQELWRCLLKYLKPVERKTVSEHSQTEADVQLEKMLQIHFLKHYKTKIAEVAQAMELSDIKLAHRLVHTLKSNAGQLGKMRLQEIARNIEELLATGKAADAGKQLGVLESELLAVLDEFSKLRLEEPDDSAGQIAAAEEKFTKEKAQELAEKIKPLLKSGNPECLRFIDSIRVIPRSQQMIQQMEEFDFELALDSLAELEKGW